MMTTRSSGRSCEKDVASREKEYNSLLANMNCLNPDTWPEDIETEVLYGEIEMTSLCDRFNLPIRQCIQGFRDFKIMAENKQVKICCLLKKAISTLVVSTAECERGFSQMNILMSETSSVRFVEIELGGSGIFFKARKSHQR